MLPTKRSSNKHPKVLMKSNRKSFSWNVVGTCKQHSEFTLSGSLYMVGTTVSKSECSKKNVIELEVATGLSMGVLYREHKSRQPFQFQF